MTEPGVPAAPLAEEIRNKLLVYGYGNVGRRDDGLGPSFSDLVESRLPTLEKDDSFPWEVTCEANYQLNIEDAEFISHFDLVVFADASQEEALKSASCEVLKSDDHLEFTTHAASPAYVVSLNRELFSNTPEVYLMRIRGYEWEFQEGLSEKASVNLETAYRLFLDRFGRNTGP